MSSSRERTTILVADDEDALRSAIVDILEEEGYSTQAFSSGRALLEALDAGLVPDLILLDVVMPERSGYEVLASLQERESWRDIPVVLMTAAFLPQLPLHARAILRKPFKLGKLLTLVAEHGAGLSSARDS
jgi:CheY-like chemotaxis protein